MSVTFNTRRILISTHKYCTVQWPMGARRMHGEFIEVHVHEAKILIRMTRPITAPSIALITSILSTKILSRNSLWVMYAYTYVCV